MSRPLWLPSSLRMVDKGTKQPLVAWFALFALSGEGVSSPQIDVILELVDRDAENLLLEPRSRETNSGKDINQLFWDSGLSLGWCGHFVRCCGLHVDTCLSLESESRTNSTSLTGFGKASQGHAQPITGGVEENLGDKLKDFLHRKEIIEALDPSDEITIISGGRPMATLRRPQRTTWPCQPGTAGDTSAEVVR